MDGAASVPAWAQAWGGLRACAGVLVGDASCAEALPAEGAARAAICARIEGHAPAAPDGLWCSCSIFHGGSACEEVAAGAAVLVAPIALLMLWFAYVVRRLARTHRLLLESRHRASVGAGLTCVRLLYFSSLLNQVMMVFHILTIVPVDGVITLSVAQDAVLSTTAASLSLCIAGIMCIVVTVYETISSTKVSPEDPARARRTVMCITTAMMVFSLTVLASGRTLAGIYVLYGEAAIAALFSTHAALQLQHSFAILDKESEVMSASSFLRARIRAAVRRLRKLMLTGYLPVVLSLAVRFINTLAGLDRLGAADVPRFLFTWRWLWLYLNCFSMGWLSLSMGAFVAGPVADAHQINAEANGCTKVVGLPVSGSNGASSAPSSASGGIFAPGVTTGSTVAPLPQ